MGTYSQLRQLGEKDPEPRKQSVFDSTAAAPAKSHKDERLNAHTNEHLHERTTVQGYRSIVRRSFDVFHDQSQWIDMLALQRQSGRGSHVTKGEVVREVIDFYFEKHPIKLHE